MRSLSPFLRGEGWGQGQTPDRREYLDLYPLTRIASDDAIRPLPASGGEVQRGRCATEEKSKSKGCVHALGQRESKFTAIAEDIAPIGAYPVFDQTSLPRARVLMLYSPAKASNACGAGGMSGVG